MFNAARQALINNNISVKLYFVYCTTLSLYIIYGALMGRQYVSVREQLNDKLFANVHVHESSQTVCKRKVKIPSTMSTKDETRRAAFKLSNGRQNKVLVVIGHDKMNHVQTNNKLNAILHAMDYAQDINADLALIRNGWPTKTLKLLFGHDYQGKNDIHSSSSWEQSIERNLHLRFVDIDKLDETMHNEDYSDIRYNNSDDMYYYHTNSSLEVIKQRRQPILEYLWSHPTIRENSSKNDMCNVVNTVERKLDSVNITQYSVVHSRWMKKNGCLNRMGAFAQRMRDMTGISIDRKAPCLLEPSYIESIVKKCGLLGKPIYVITDGLNPEIVQNLQADPRIGQNVRTVPENISWVGGDMMLGVLSDCFIGTPISTLSGNIARARLALGQDPGTNYLFPQKRQNDDEEFEFSCQSSADCLYDVRVLSHYVG